MASCAYGIDLGTNNIKIYAKGNKGIFTAKNMIAIERKDILDSLIQYQYLLVKLF